MKSKLYSEGLKFFVVSTLISLPLSSIKCNSYNESNNNSNLEKITEESNEKYPFERFKIALGNRYDESYEFNEGWKNAGEDERRFFCLIYEDPKKITDSFTTEEKIRYDRFNPDKMSKEQMQGYENEIPWKLIPKDNKFSESDRLMTFYMYIDFFD